MEIRDIYEYPFGKVKFCKERKSYYINGSYRYENDKPLIKDYDFKYSLGKEYHIISSQYWMTSGGHNFIVDFKNQIIYTKKENEEYAKFFVRYFPWCWGI